MGDQLMLHATVRMHPKDAYMHTNITSSKETLACAPEVVDTPGRYKRMMRSNQEITENLVAHIDRFTTYTRCTHTI